MMLRRLLITALLIVGLASPSYATQTTLVTPGAPLSMSSLATFLNNALLSVGGCNSGSAAPSASPSPFLGECWLNTTTATAETKSIYDGAQWVTTGTLNTSAHTWTPVLPSISSSYVLGNFSGSSAAASAQQVPSCAGDGSHALTNPSAGGFACTPITGGGGGTPCTTTASSLQYDASGSFGCVLGATSDGTHLTVANSDLRILGSSTGYNTLTMANASSSNYTTTIPANTGTVMETNLAQTLSATLTGPDGGAWSASGITGITGLTTAAGLTISGNNVSGINNMVVSNLLTAADFLSSLNTNYGLYSPTTGLFAGGLNVGQSNNPASVAGGGYIIGGVFNGDTHVGADRQGAGLGNVDLDAGGITVLIAESVGGAVIGSPGYTVSTLPTTHVQGNRTWVTDQATTCAAPGGTLTGSGSKVCPVFDNGSSWVGG